MLCFNFDIRYKAVVSSAIYSFRLNQQGQCKDTDQSKLHLQNLSPVVNLHPTKGMSLFFMEFSFVSERM